MEIRPELKSIAESLKKLRDDNIIRTKNLVGDLGEYYCKELLGLSLNENVIMEGFDATDKEGKKVEIKTRRTPYGNTKIIFKNLDFDYCLYVELNEYYEPIQILKVFPDEIKKTQTPRGIDCL